MNHATNFQAELHYWEQWCRTILVFLGDTPRIPSVARSLAGEVSTSAGRGDLIGLRTIAGSLSEMAQGLQPEARERLDAVLESRFGRNLHHVTGFAEIAARRALKKGRIDTDGEFRLVRSYLSEAIADPSRTQQAERIDVLITNYEPEGQRQDTPVAPRTGTRG